MSFFINLTICEVHERLINASAFKRQESRPSFSLRLDSLYQVSQTFSHPLRRTNHRLFVSLIMVRPSLNEPSAV